jgi:hypothetical protein
MRFCEAKSRIEALIKTPFFITVEQSAICPKVLINLVKCGSDYNLLASLVVVAMAFVLAAEGLSGVELRNIVQDGMWQPEYTRSRHPDRKSGERINMQGSFWIRLEVPVLWTVPLVIPSPRNERDTGKAGGTSIGAMILGGAVKCRSQERQKLTTEIECATQNSGAHHPLAFTTWMGRAGSRAGVMHRATDETTRTHSPAGNNAGQATF